MSNALRTSFFEELALRMKTLGFYGGNGRFVRTRVLGWHDVVTVRLLKYSSSYRVSTGVGVRADAVEEVFHRFSDRSKADQKRSTTIATELLYLCDQARWQTMEPWLKDSDDVVRSAVCIHSLAEEVAEPFFVAHSTLEDLDRVLNTTPTEPCALRAIEWERAAAGVIVASLLSRSDLGQLARQYESLLETADVTERDRFDALLQSFGISNE